MCQDQAVEGVPPLPAETVRRRYHSDLYLALKGKGLSRRFERTVQENGAWLDGVEDDAVGDVPATAWSKIIMNEHAPIFTQGDLANPVDEEGAEQRQALIDRFTGEIAEALRKARKDAQANSAPLAAQRVSYLTMAGKLMAAGNYQTGFELYETARELERVAMLDVQAKGAETVPQAGSQDRRNPNVVRDRGETAPTQEDVDRLQGLFDALEARSTAMDAFAARLLQNQLISQQEHATHQGLRRPAQDKLDSIGVPILRPFPDAEDAAAFRQTLRDQEKAINETHGLLNAAEEPLTKGLHGASKALLDSAKKLIDTSRAHLFYGTRTIDRSGGDLDGGGDVVAAAKAASVPSPVLNEIAALIETIDTLGKTGQFDPLHADLVMELRAEAQAKIHSTLGHLDQYDKAKKRVTEIKAILHSEDCAYHTAEHSRFENLLETYETRINTDVVDALSKLDQLKIDLTAALPQFQQKKSDVKDLTDDIDGARSGVIREYANLQKATVKRYEALEQAQVIAAAQRVHRSKFKSLRGIIEYEGKHAAALDALSARLSPGDPNSVAARRGELTALVNDVRADIATLTTIKTQLEQLKAQGGTPDQAILNDLTPAIDDLTRSGDEVHARARLQKEFEQQKTRLSAFITVRKDGILQDMREAFENYELLINVYDKRSKGLVSAADWQDFLNDFKKFDDAVRRFAETHRAPPPMPANGAKPREILLAARALRDCSRYLHSFKTDMEAFSQKVTDRQPDYERDLERLPDPSPDRAHLTEIIAILDTKEGALRSFASQIADAVDTQELDQLAMDLVDVAKNGEIRIREKALSVMRRRRDFLEKAKTVSLYRENPYDFGAAATVMIQSLAKAENDLLTFVKPR